MKPFKYILIVFMLLPRVAASQETIHAEEILIINDSIQLPGILTYEPSSTPTVLAIFIQGSGNPDRNGNQLAMNIKANYIKQLAESLYMSEIAMFRYDKRNVPVANHKYVFSHYKFEDLVDDVTTIINHFKDDQRFNKIVLIGHSQGSLVGMLAVNHEVDGFVSLSGLSKRADKAIVWQLSKQNEGLSKVAESHFKELRETGKIKETNPFLISIFAKANLEFMKSYMLYEPTEIIATLKVPVLILNGDMDLQVPIDDAKELLEANPDASFKIIANMNHVLKHLEKDTDNMKSYFSADYPISMELVETLVSFIKH